MTSLSSEGDEAVQAFSASYEKVMATWAETLEELVASGASTH